MGGEVFIKDDMLIGIVLAIDETGEAIIPACKLNIDGGYNE